MTTIELTADDEAKVEALAGIVEVDDTAKPALERRCSVKA